MSSTENSPGPNGGERRTGLSKEAWVAISTIAAALITGIVTLIIHLSPPKPAATPAATPAAASSSPSFPARGSAAVTADSIAGKWFGTATDKTGVTFELRLDVRKGCGINEKCGSISVSHVPCYGEVFLERARDEDFEFRTANFYGESDHQKCVAGAGELFHLRPDGKLDYSTNYGNDAKGVLERLGG